VGTIEQFRDLELAVARALTSCCDRPQAWWNLLFTTFALLSLVAFILIPGCYVRVCG
jgi:hypothetical protein